MSQLNLSDAQRIYKEYNAKHFGGKLPTVVMDISNKIAFSQGTGGVTYLAVSWNTDREEVVLKPIKIDLSKSVFKDETLLRRVVLHEMIHVLEYQDLIERLKKASSPSEVKVIMRMARNDEHGAVFISWMNKINKIEGKNFIEVHLSETLERKVEKPYYLLIEPHPTKKDTFFYAPYYRLSTDLKERALRKKEKGGKLIKTDSPSFFQKSLTKGYSYISEPAQNKELKELYESDNLVVAATAPVGCLMLNLEDCVEGSVLLSMFDNVQKLIPEDAVLEQHPYSDKERNGLEDTPHITVFYGLTSKEDISPISDKAKDLKFPFKFAQIDKFADKDEYDVLKITVESKDLTNFHYWIRENFDNTTTYEYNAHSTLAYVKKGSCDHLLGPCELTGVWSEPTKLVCSFGDEEDTYLEVLSEKTKLEVTGGCKFMSELQGSESVVTAAYSDWKNVWYHYSKHPEMKVNPKTMFKDPAGIYFFPEGFEPRGLWKTYPYKFKVTISPSAKVLSLGEITLEDGLSIVEQMLKNYSKEWETIVEGKPSSVDALWDLLTNLFMTRQGTLNKLFRDKGVDAIFDDQYIIHNNEVQLIVLDPRIIQTREMLTQDDSAFETLTKIQLLLAEDLKKYGKVLVEPIKRKTQYREDFLKGFVTCTLPSGKTLDWSVSANLKKYKEYGYLVALQDSDLSFKYGRSFGKSLEYPNWNKDWSDLLKEVERVIQLKETKDEE